MIWLDKIKYLHTHIIDGIYSYIASNNLNCLWGSIIKINLHLRKIKNARQWVLLFSIVIINYAKLGDVIHPCIDSKHTAPCVVWLKVSKRYVRDFSSYHSWWKYIKINKRFSLIILKCFPNLLAIQSVLRKKVDEKPTAKPFCPTHYYGLLKI